MGWIILIIAIILCIGNPALGITVLVIGGVIIWICMTVQADRERENSTKNHFENLEKFKGFNSIKTKTVGDYTFLISEGYEEMGVKYNSNAIVESPVRKRLEKLTKVEILKDDVTIRESGVGRAVVGGIIAGGAGAVVGANTAKQTTEVERIVIKFTFSDISNPIHKVNAYQKNRDSLKLQWKNVLNEADELVAIFDAIRDEVKKDEIKENTENKEINSDNNFEEKLLKLAKLRDNNIITQEEFDQKKKEIMDRL